MDQQIVANESVRSGILDIEAKMKEVPGAFIGDNDVCPLKHSFADGVYVREIFIPKNTLIVGKLHRHSHPNFILSGDVSVLTEEGPRRIKGPCSMISPAGTKRVVYTHEDTTWITVHVTKERDLDKIEKEIIAENYEALTKEEFNMIEAFANEVSK